MNLRLTFGLRHFDEDRSEERQTQTKVGKKDQVVQSTLREKKSVYAAAVSCINLELQCKSLRRLCILLAHLEIVEADAHDKVEQPVEANAEAHGGIVGLGREDFGNLRGEIPTPQDVTNCMRTLKQIIFINGRRLRLAPTMTNGTPPGPTAKKTMIKTTAVTDR